jgi:gamma-glutamyltranspeptidase/glutathione hydrolase
LTAAAVVTPHHLSADAGRQILLDGGNAVDAAIAIVAAQGVVAPETCGLGGDLFALVHSPGWPRPRALNASGRAGAGADPEILRLGGHSEIPLDHAAVVTVPGCVDGLLTLARELGTRPMRELLRRAIALAEDGFEVSQEQSQAFERQAATYRDNPAVASFYPEGRPVHAGEHVRRPELAATLAGVASGDRSDFYAAQPGHDIVAAVGGMITLEDLARDQAEWVDPISVDVFGMTAWTTPPNSQGYLGPAALRVFEILGPPDDPGDPMWWHMLIESYRSLAWERDDLVSDPERSPLPAAKLVEEERLHRLASMITGRAGVWPSSTGRTSGTAYMCVADGTGMGVSIIQSNYRGTGSPFGAARSGFLLHDRGLGFSLMPGHPNELTPGRRPMHTLSPTLWTKGDRASWLIGTRGGAIQPQLVAQMAARVVGAGIDPAVAQTQPRWAIADFGPGTGSDLAVEPGVTDHMLTALGAMGHGLTVLPQPQPGWGPVSVIGLEGDIPEAASDPRVATSSAMVIDLSS